jgi:Acyl carrier protein
MRSDTEILDKVIAELRKVTAPGTEVHPQSSIMGDLGLDSLTVMNFVMSLEDAFDISLPMDRIAQVETVADLAQALESLGARVAR